MINLWIILEKKHKAKDKVLKKAEKTFTYITKIIKIIN